MARGLSITRQELEEQVATRTSELQKAIDAATKADAERRRLIARGNALLEEERRRIAAELHDHLAASLIFLRMEAQRIANLAARTAGASEAQEIRSVAQRLAQTTSELYESARNLVKQLRPEVIDTLGLTGAIEEMVHNYDGLKSGCRFSFEVRPGFPDLRGELAITAYRVVQEALSNVLKHADATLARVTLEPTQPGHVRITIADNGKGFDTGTSMSAGIGLIGMRERVFNAGGSMNLTSDPLSGTRIAIELPAKEPSAQT
jgi:two-component system sensor histidine kinase UhpB